MHPTMERDRHAGIQARSHNDTVQLTTNSKTSTAEHNTRFFARHHYAPLTQNVNTSGTASHWYYLTSVPTE